jgi:serine/threonine-protein kinase
MTRSRNAEESSRRPVPPVASGSADHVPVGLRVQGRYRIVGELGTGLLGTVCRAEDEATGHAVAMRLLPRGLFGASHVAAVRERKGGAIVSASAAHPALVGVLEFGQAEMGADFTVMDLAEGRRLSEVLADGPLDVDVALRVAMELGGAIETLHAAGLAHGALRPRNVVVDEEWRVKLLDVELCGLRGERVMRVVGGAETPQEYLSLEQIRRSAVTEETDVYAFGVMLYEMFTGAPPFQAKTRDALLKKQVAETPIPLRRRRRAVPSAVEAMVALMLSKRPERRPTIQSVLNCLWQQVNRPARRWKRAAAVTAGVVLAASIPVLVGWGLFAPGSRPPIVQPTASPEPASLSAPAPAPAGADTGAAEAVTPAPAPSAPSTVQRAAPPEGTRSPARPAAPPAAPRRQQPPASQPVTERPGERAPATNSSDDPDPGAVVDWLLERAAAAKRK